MKRNFVFILLVVFCFSPLSLSAQESDITSEPMGTLIEPEIQTAEAGEDAADTLVENESKITFFAHQIILALAIVAGLAFFIWLIWQIFKKLSVKIAETAGTRIKPFTIKKQKLLSAKQITNVMLFFLRLLKYVITVFLLILIVPIVFSLFPATRSLASTIFGYILTPLKQIGIGFAKYIPNLFTIVIIILITRYALKGLKFFSTRIATGKLVIPGFFSDWAQPSYKILQFLLLAFTVAIIYPYLPGSDSKIFQGVSVFVGIIFSLGSSSAIGNMVAGLVITYMRSFKIGDRVKINEITGFVVEKNLMVVRVKTHKNEYVSFPNLMILNSGIVNYNTSSDEDEEGLILNTEITFGYSTPWQAIHKILIEAALATEYVQKRPHPFVLQTAMDNFYAHYQINCYTKHVDKVPAIYAQLYENIQNGFTAEGIDMTAAHYHVVSRNEGKQNQ
jgi:small-conductance mechanosensitive channel